jgi:hypothetical protein
VVVAQELVAPVETHPPVELPQVEARADPPVEEAARR